MTTRSISNQLKTIKNATKKASSSKEAAIAFLLQAGIINKSGSFVIKSAKAKVSNDSKNQKVVKTTGNWATKNKAVSHAKSVSSKDIGPRKTASKK